MILSHRLCVRRLDWRAEERGGVVYCTGCGAPMDSETQEHAEILHRLLFPHRQGVAMDDLFLSMGSEG